MSTTWPISLQRNLHSVGNAVLNYPLSLSLSLPIKLQFHISVVRKISAGVEGRKMRGTGPVRSSRCTMPQIEGRIRDKSGNSGKNSFLRKDSLHSLYLFRDTGWNNGVCPDLEISLLTAANNPVYIFGGGEEGGGGSSEFNLLERRARGRKRV